MAQRITKLQRWLDVVAFLVGRRFLVPIEDVMDGVPAYAEKWRTGEPRARAAARRMFERDKDELRAAGIPLERIPDGVTGSAEPVAGYRLAARDFYLPYLRLVARGERGAAGGRARGGGLAGLEAVELPAEQLELALDALRRVAELPASPLAADARSALRKLTFDLEPDTLALAPLIYAAPRHAREVAPTVRALSQALLARKRVRFRYRGIQRDEPTTREVSPYGLLFRQGHWYLVGHDALRGAVRVFRADRMAQVERNPRRPHTPDYEVPSDFRLARFVEREAWELGDDEPVRVQVRFQFPASLWAERNRKGELVERRRDGSEVRAFQVRELAPFLRWLLSFKGEARVVEPRALECELAGLAARVAGVHGGAGAPQDDGGVRSGRAHTSAAPLHGDARARRTAAERGTIADHETAAEHGTTAERLGRLLCLIPLAAREGGIRLDELAPALGVSVPNVVADLQELAARAYYQPAGPADEIQVLLEPERVQIWTTGELRRPPRLSPREALALGLGLRALALEVPAARQPEVRHLARRLERALAVEPAEAWLPRYAIVEGDAAGAEIRTLVARAARDRVRCRLRYLKPGASAPEERLVQPYAVASAEGSWYLIGRDEARRAVRLFRVDRILEAAATAETFEPPADFDPAEYLRDGRAYRAEQEIDVLVRYSPRIARWIAERHDVDRCPDGSVLVKHRVADPEWIVRGVLYYAGEAEVLEPAWVRAEVTECAGRIAELATQRQPLASRRRRPGPARGGRGRADVSAS